MAEHFKNAALRALAQLIIAAELPMVDQRRKHVRSKEEQCAVKVSRRHADYGERLFVKPHRTANYIRIILEMTVPVAVAEHHIGSAVVAMFIGAVEQTSEIRLNAHRVEVVPRDLV